MTYRSTLQILNSLIQPVRRINFGKVPNWKLPFIEKIDELRQYLIFTR